MLTRAHKLLLMDGPAPILSRAQAYWKTSQYSGSGSLLDLSGHGHDLAFPGGAANPTWLAYNGVKYVYLPGIAANYISTPDAADISITGDIDIRCAVAMDDWTPSGGALGFLVSKLNSSGTGGYEFQVRDDVGLVGGLRLNWGTGAASRTADSTVAPTVTDGALLLVRVTLDVDDGSGNRVIKFYTRTSTEASAAADVADDTVGAGAWVQLGATVTTAGTTSISDGTEELRLGMRAFNTTTPLAAKFYAVCIKNGIAGTTVVNTSFNHANVVEPYASFSDGTRTWTFNRSATGKKLAVVDRSMLLFGTDDYLETPDHPLLDFGATDSFTLAIVTRLHGMAGAGVKMLMSKRATAGSAGWLILKEASATQYTCQVNDGTLSTSPVKSGLTNGVLTAAVFRRDVSLDQVQVFADTTGGTALTDTTTATLANALVVRVGSDPDGTTRTLDGEFVGAAIFREALSASDLARLVTDLKAA